MDSIMQEKSSDVVSNNFRINVDITRSSSYNSEAEEIMPCERSEHPTFYFYNDVSTVLI